ncbi:hypothetical protein B0H14DRAFT_2620392 [Mycena olivaceomarginata]|nr:hypothetical protein B0H14DRAFT_2620392 [Mycena olivaceomarginata]
MATGCFPFLSGKLNTAPRDAPLSSVYKNCAGGVTLLGQDSEKKMGRSEKEKSGFGGTTRPGVEPGPAGDVQLGSWRADSVSYYFTTENMVQPRDDEHSGKRKKKRKDKTRLEATE